jgi:hypothetical protein
VEGSRFVAAVAGLAQHTDNAFRWAVCQMADRLLANPDHILAVMCSETGHTFSPSIKNPNGGATGLIQFMPATAKHMGTSTAELAAMTAVEQLAFVERYYSHFRGKLHSPEDVYMATFMPIHVGKGGDNVIAVEGSAVYAQNKGFDRDHDGIITNSEVGSVARGVLEKAKLLPPIEVFPDDGSSSSGSGSGGSFFPTCIALSLAYVGVNLFQRSRQ